MKKLFLLVLLTCCSLSAFSQKPTLLKYEDFMAKIKSIRLGCDKETVIQIMGEPYKISFAQYKEKDTVEQLSYKVNVDKTSWYKVNYGFVFYNSRLIVLVETEFVEGGNSTALDQSSIGHVIKNILPEILPDTEKNTCTCESSKEQQTAISQ